MLKEKLPTPSPVSETDIPDRENIPPIVIEKSEKQQPVVPHSPEKEKVVEEEKMEVDEKSNLEPQTPKPKKESDVDVVDNLSQKNNVSLIQEESPTVEKVSSVVPEQSVSEAEVKVNQEGSGDHQQRDDSVPLIHNTESETFPASPTTVDSQITIPSTKSQSDSQDNTEQTDSTVNNSQTPQVASLPSPASLSPEPAETIIASIGSEGTVIVRTPTPTPPEPTQSQQPVKKESVVTYSGKLETRVSVFYLLTLSFLIYA